MKPTNVGLTKGKTGNNQVSVYPDNLERLCVHVPTTTARKRRDGGTEMGTEQTVTEATQTQVRS